MITISDPAVYLQHGFIKIRLDGLSITSRDSIQELVKTFIPDTPLSTDIEVFAAFLEHCVNFKSADAPTILDAFCDRYSIDSDINNIHCIIDKHGLDESGAQLVLRAFYLLWSNPALSHHYNPKSPSSALLSPESTANVMALFGGQHGGSTSCMDEASWLLDVYGPLVSEYAALMSEFLDTESKDPRVSQVYQHGLDVYKWICKPATKPSEDYVRGIAVSLPVVGLTQLMQIMVLFKTLGLSPGELVSRFKVAVGHSQGVAIAAAFSMLTDEASFESISRKILGIHFLSGAVPQMAYPMYKHISKTKYNSIDKKSSDGGVPRPMVTVQGVSKQTLAGYVDTFNKRQRAAAEHVFLAIINAFDNYVVAGELSSVANFVSFLHSHSAKAEDDQNRIPFNERRPVISTNYLKITAPYHCVLLQESIEPMLNIAQEKKWTLDSSEMQLPVRALDDGHDIRKQAELTKYLLESLCVLQVNWPCAVDPHGEITHIVDFGPGGTTGFGYLAYRNIEGSGVPVICAGALTTNAAHPHMGTRADIYKHDMDNIVRVPNWFADFGPRLVRVASSGEIHLDTAMHRILGKPTVMVAGMTPTTVNETFVAAINNAGYHAEIAGGGMHNEEAMDCKLQSLAKMIPAGQGITLNCIYINPKQWGFQFPALLRMREDKGLPVAGLCIGGGVPSFDVAMGIIDSLRNAGIRHMSFKPSSASAIRSVIRIAQASQGFPILLQWTGGRAGGHHSLEDFHQPLLETYAAIRTCSNMALVVGSGFGDAEGTLPYVTGEWSTRFGRAPMPVDGILLASRVMVAKEAGTSHAAKELIVAAPGISDQEWVKTFSEEGSGVTSVLSELGELNHAIATRALRLVQDMRTTVLSQPRDKLLAVLRERKDEIIARLNADYMRPWFGCKADGSVVDVQDMTYAEVISRMVSLMYIAHQMRWTATSYKRRVLEFIDRTERRFVEPYETDCSFVKVLSHEDPLSYVDLVSSNYPRIHTQLLASEDVQFFVAMCKRGGQLPLPFIPVLDADFGMLLQKNTYWQSEDLDSVVDQDPQRTIIQHGPVAAQFSRTVDEPVKDILDSIYHAHVAAILDANYSGNASFVPVVEYIGDDPLPVNDHTLLLEHVSVAENSDSTRVYQLPDTADELPEHHAWLQSLAGPNKCWMQALLTSTVVVRGSTYASNVVRHVMRPRAGQTVTVQLSSNGTPQSINVANRTTDEPRLSIERTLEGDIVVTVYHQVPTRGRISLPLEFSYHPEQPTVPIHQYMDRYAKAEQSLFAQAWVDSAEPPRPYTDMTDSDMVLRGPGFTITMDHVRAFSRNIGDHVWNPKPDPLSGKVRVPLDYVHMSLISDILCVLGPSNIGGGQLEIVHTNFNYHLLDDAEPLFVGDSVTSEVVSTHLTNTPKGRTFGCHGKMFCNGKQIGEMRSMCLGLGHSFEPSRMVKRVEDEHFTVVLSTTEEALELGLKEWFSYRDPSLTAAAGSVVEFRLDSVYRYKNDFVYSSVKTTGTAMLQTNDNRFVHLGDVDYEWYNCAGNQVTDYLNNHLAPSTEWMFDSGSYPLDATADKRSLQCTVPDTNYEYSMLGGDRNPIHINEYIADVAGLPGALTQGQWTNAATRAIVELHAADGEMGRLRRFEIECVGMVLPKDTLAVDIVHYGMRDGRMLVSGNTSNIADDTVVIKYMAEIEQPRTAYVFTGQGSQAANMGMDQYDQSPAAKRVWDRADSHMLRKYGVSLLNVVRNNPQTLAVHFGGDSGEGVRRNYLALNSDTCTKPLFAGIHDDSQCYTFYSPNGLLNATQFTQPALVVMALAAVADMRAHSMVQRNAVFAGHSLGEFAALASLGNGLLSVEEVVDIAFYRGMLMQSAVSRDQQGFSGFAMVAVNPQRLGPGFDEAKLSNAIGLIRSALSSDGMLLLEIANYNIRGQQYVVSGALLPLAALRMVLDSLSESREDVASAVDKVLNCAEYLALRDSSKHIAASALNGHATVLLNGIDVPFHSSQLLPCVAPLRTMLQKHILANNVDVRALRKRYIPNLTAQPFDISKEYFALVHGITQSPVLQITLDKWSNSDSAHDKRELAAELIIELLAYQLASPVQWIDTQDQLLLEALGVRRIIEIGTTPVLCAMANNELEASGFMCTDIDVLHISQDRESIFYIDRKPVVEEEAQPKQQTAVTAPVEREEPATISADDDDGEDVSDSGAADFDDQAPQAIDIIAAVLSRKFKMEREAVPLDKSIKALAAGKSTLQNEIFGDLHKEFAGKLPSKVEDLVLSELAASVGSFDGQLGKHTQAQITRLFSSKMPGGFSLSAARSLLQSSYGLGPKRQDAVLLYALASEPNARLGSESEAHQWIGDLATRYAKQAGISLNSSRSAGGKAGGAGGPIVSSAAIDEMKKKQMEFARQQMEVLARYAGVNLTSANIRADTEKAKVAGLQSKLDMLEGELGDEFTEGIMPRFDARKARHFDSYWSWARQDAYDWIQQALLDGVPDDPCVLAARVLRMQSCADSALLSLLEGMALMLEKQQSHLHRGAMELAHTLRDACKQAIDSQPAYKETTRPLQPETKVVGDGIVDYREVPRTGEPSFSEYVQNMQLSPASHSSKPCLYLKERCAEDSTRWVHSSDLSSAYYAGLDSLCSAGISFAGKTALVTGCGKGSIGFDIVRGLLAGGAKVIATTSSYSRNTMGAFESVYQESGARGSELIVVPFNQGSVQDTQQLIDYAFGTLGWDLDYVVPFAAVSDLGSFATSIGSKSEFSQRVMLTNVIRLLGGIKDAKEKRRLMFRPTLAVLPLSPNHGTFGGDGLYGECKAGLETLLNRWKSEDWCNYMAIAGTFIGWVRGTGLMAQNNHIAQQIESHGARTFTTREMAFNILGLMDPRVCRIASKQVICAEFDGGLGAIDDMSNVAGSAKLGLEAECAVKHLVNSENIQSFYAHYQDVPDRTNEAAENLYVLAQHDHCFPQPQSYDSLEHLRHLQDTVNLDKVVVITGYGEVGPYGHAETRWQMEAFGELTIAGCIELAWIMGLIKHVNGPLSSGVPYIGWVDAKSGEPVRDEDVKPQYLEYILSHTGIRLIEPDMSHGYDPDAKTVLREVQIEHDMDPFEATAEDAQEYKKSNKDKVDIWEISEGTWSVRFLKGAVIRVPVTIIADRLVAGLIPTGWNPTLFGIPEDLAKQIDMVTMYTLVATVEALVRSGITDPYELYKYFHVSEVGSAMGSGIGGGLALRKIVKGRFLEEDIDKDVLQETFISTIQAWVNMLLMSCAGPVKPVVGACATGLLSIDVAIETIQSGKARVMLAGGVEDFGEENSTEFGNMGATNNSLDDFAVGRTPAEGSRPCTTTRNGFVESLGAGVVVLMSASAAIACGAPIYGIVAMNEMASDKQGRSVPAPGQGILSFAQESPAIAGCIPPCILDFDHRKCMFDEYVQFLDFSREKRISAVTSSNAHMLAQIDSEHKAAIRHARDMWFNEFWKKRCDISPVRGSLAVWGLSVDDIGMASFHATSTVANDKNESEVMNKQFCHLGRTPGNVVPIVCQKWLTGHPKGPAAIYMLNGVIQSLRTGIIPGNRNADNIDKELKHCEYALYLSKTVKTPGIKAAMLTSFGFGQVGGELLIVHPDHVLATLGQEQLDEYNGKLTRRNASAYRYWQDTLIGNHPFIRIKDHPPFTSEQEEQVYLDPTVRVHLNTTTGEYEF